MILILTDNHFEAIMDLFDSTKKSITIISPFLSCAMADKLCDIVRKKQIPCTFITRLYVQDLLAKASNLTALRDMMNAGISIYLMKGLHTKLYLFDEERAIVGSANFTASGFKSNIELSILFDDERCITQELSAYCSKMKTLLTEKGGLLTEEILSEAEADYKRLWASNKGSIPTRSGKMYGVSLERKTVFEKTTEIDKELAICENECKNDIVHSFFSRFEIRKQLLLDHNAWIKFSGEANSRLDPDEPFPVPCVTLQGRAVFVSNYSYNPTSVNEGDEVYFAALTTDCKGKKQPVIVGRGHFRAYDKKNTVPKEWLEDYPWMERYSHYVVINEGEIINTCVRDGLPLDTVLEKFGSDTYIASFGQNESIAEVASKHYQKAHLRLSGNAKEFIDYQLDARFKQYGKRNIVSE